jgi:N-acetylglucosamine-6-phosphate deacetylase
MCKNFYKGITLDGKAMEVTVKGSKISGVREIEPEPRLSRLLPPLVDLQHNGALGIAYNNLNGEAPEQLQRVADLLIRNGVGRVLATFPTAPYEVLNTSAAALKSALDADEVLDSLFFGIFHEGVFISPADGWRGGHDPAYILAPDWDKFRILNALTGNRVKLVNVAPEEPGALDFIEKAASSGLKVALGHCCPDTEIINEAVNRGASVVTHFANGAAALIHRFKNPLWGFFDNEKLSLGLIGDGFHLPPELVRAALRIKGQDRCFMVSDANMYSGCRPGSYKRLGGIDCVIEPNGFIHHITEQDILAGAWFQNNRSVEFLVNSVGLSFTEAWKMCSVTPARLMNLRLPGLQAGDEATFVQATFQDGELNIEQSVFCGKEYVLGQQDSDNIAFNPKTPEADNMSENGGFLKS